jgi:tetratricopeptide (TPR) repeat protein
MAGTLTTSSAEQIIAQCERGIYEPWHGSEPVDLLARGMVESATGDPEVAKDLLSEACWSLEGELKDRAGIQLAVAYWRGGEREEAIALLDTLPAGFDLLLTQAIIETDNDPRAALALLERARAYDASRYRYARLHNQRGICFSLLGEPQMAREEYDAALCLAGDCPLRSLIGANIGIDLEPSAASGAADKAIGELSGSNLGQAYENKARALFHGGECERAEEYATWAVDLFTSANRRAWLVGALFTRAEIRDRLDRHGEAIIDLHEAYKVADYLSDSSLKIKAAKQIYLLAKSLSKAYHVRCVQLALETSSSLNSAAKKVGTSRPALQEFMQSNRLTFKSARRESIIKKS